jgi:hypothetical protein
MGGLPFSMRSCWMKAGPGGASLIGRPVSGNTGESNTGLTSQ